ncbi:MAG: polyribonucleotide nucleotidyltransferase [Candidatus Omnitrophica bacterium]|nr:polyribonucleotide nucleotidyltransferase [Candidatus Omnitrophota bacterium]MCM8810580.1 polyribonucleotide nucleotidyltransferase [Candidatus Omnitrophota bacterium]
MKKIVISSGEKNIEIEINAVAKQSSGSSLVRCGDTIVLTTCVQGEEKQDSDFFPLICDYREQTSAAGKIPGGFFKREGKPSEREILISRLIDRSIRPIFPDHFYKEIQVISLVLSADQENEPDILSIIGASTSLLSSSIPFSIPIGCVRVVKRNGKFLINPNITDIQESELNLVISATENSIIMLEGIGKEISEDVFLSAIEFGWNEIKKMINILKEIVNPEKEKVEFNFEKEIFEKITEYIRKNLPNAYNYPEKQKRKEFYTHIKEAFLVQFEEEEKKKEVEKIYEYVFEKEVRNLILNSKKRLDGRALKEIRPIECKIGLLPRNHGSALFTRGQTQCLASVTLGTSMDQQIVDGLYEETTKRFMVHYNFPPFCVGEVSQLKAPSRREIGHGNLVERALLPIIPSEKIFPYTIRIVANILESNGSSSMATACAGSLSLMDAGVPIEKHVGGVSVGLIKEGSQYIILTDIQGEEDHYGDMDLKIAGTLDGITGFQMDVKTTDLTLEILEKAIYQSKEARKEILDKMYSTISSPKSSLSPYAPKILTIKINPEKVGLVIGSGGKTIKKIIDETGVKIDILEEGEIRIYSNDLEACKKAASEINKIAEEPEIGQIYEGVVTKIFPFGAIVRFLPSQEGLIHISELAPYRIKRVEDVVKVGSTVKVKVIGKDEQGRVLLSKKQIEENYKKGDKDEQSNKSK